MIQVTCNFANVRHGFCDGTWLSGCGQVPTLRETMLKRNDWQQIADKQRATVFSESASMSGRSRLEAFMKSLELFDDDVLAGQDSIKVEQ